MKRIAPLFAAAMLIAAPAFAAGTMSSVNQEIDVSNANITSDPASMGVSGSVGYGDLDVEAGKAAGGVTIGKIANEGGKMESVSQKLNASGATIKSSGAGVEIGSISNSK